MTGRIANAEEVAQIWAGDERLSVADDGRFALTLEETTFDAAESLDLTLIFKDGSRMDQALALREAPPVADVDVSTGEAGQPLLTGKLGSPEDVAEIRIDGRTVPLSEDGAFSLAISEQDISVTRSISITIVHRDGSVSQQRVATGRRAIMDEFRPALTEVGTLAVEDGKVRAAGKLASPETVAAVEIAGEKIELSEDGSFVLEIDETVINVNESVDITIIYARSCCWRLINCWAFTSTM